MNCRSLLSIADEVSDLIVHYSTNVFVVTETWLDSSIEDYEIFPYSFPITVVRNDHNRHIGVVAFCSFQGSSLWLDLCKSTIESLNLDRTISINKEVCGTRLVS